MNLWNALEIIDATNGELIGDSDWTAKRLVMDSREIEPGDIFIALKGEADSNKFRSSGMDGHDFVASAIDKGAVAVIVDHDVSVNSPQIIVRNTFEALQQLGAFSRKRAALKTCIAVTGSVGKTTVRDMIERAFVGVDVETHASIKSYNNMIGVPYMISNMPRDSKIGIFECGMDKAGELSPLSQQIQPNMAVITTIAAQHVENFTNGMNGIVDAKSEIFDGLIDDGKAILPIDNEYYNALVENAQKSNVKNIYTFGKHERADARLIGITYDSGAMSVDADIMGEHVKYMLRTMGEHMAVNSLIALLTVKLSGENIHKAAKALEAIKPLPGRGEITQITLDEKNASLTLVDDAYNAAPVAVEMALKNLGRMTPNGAGRRVAFIGRMAELGDMAEKMHAGLAKPFADAGIDILYCSGPDSEHFYNAVPENKRGAIATQSTDLADHVKDLVKPGDVVLVKGSHGSKMNIVVDAIKALHKDRP